MNKDKNSLLLIALYGVIAIVALYTGYKFLSVRGAMQAHMADTSLGQFQGNPDAEKVIVEFMDYRCSYCRTMHPTVQEVLRRNPDVKVVYRHFPVFGRPSVIDAEVALAAGMQGKFSEAHNALLARSEPMNEEEIDAFARSLGLNMTKFYQDLKGPEIGYLLLQTMDMTEALGVKGTPAFFVGDKMLILDDQTPHVEAFEKALAEQYGS